jgi:hypothetical protein
MIPLLNTSEVNFFVKAEDNSLLFCTLLSTKLDSEGSFNDDDVKLNKLQREML